MKELRFFLLICLLILMALATPALGKRDSDPEPSQYSLHPSEIITDIAVTVSIGLAQQFIPLNKDSQRLFPDKVNSLDESIRDRWHTKSKSDNFLDGSDGSLYTPLATCIIMVGLDLAEKFPSLKIGNEFFIFGNGALADKFLTKIFKRAFSRRRPLLEFADPDERLELDKNENNFESFFSGHASTAFYSASFLRRRIAQSLQRFGHTGVKSGYQWSIGVSVYTWAAYVGYSRIQIDKHYFTDVAAGAIMGMLFEEIYYRINKEHWNFSSSWCLAPQVSSESFQVCFSKRFR